MGGREPNADDGPKLREEINYQDFYPTLTKDDQIPLLINEHNNSVDDIYINADKHNLEFNQGIQVKQLICNGKITVEPLVIESMESGCHSCNIKIMKLNDDATYLTNTPINGMQSNDKKTISNSPFQEPTYLTKLDTDNELSSHDNLEIIQNNKSNYFTQLKARLCKITPNLNHLNQYYDMDEQDELFLQHLKKQYDDLTIDNLQFELFFTILELEYALLQSHIPRPPPPPAYTDQLCSICDGIETENNTIVFCDCCNIAVHQDCYGIIFIPPGPWLCRVCSQNSMLSQRPRCIVCPEINGPMKQTTSGNWIHVTCAVWIRELNFGNWHYLEPVEGVERIPNLRWKLNCFICRQKIGACIQCCNKNCFTAYHVSCAKRLGLTMTPLKTGSIAEMALGNDNELESFCDKHSHLVGETDKNRTFDSKIQDLRYEIERDDEIYRGNLQNEIVIPPHIFSDYIFQSIVELGLLNDNNKAHELSFAICKYWSMKREYNRGEPLFDISDTIFQYCYNLLEETDIKNKLSFIDVILEDLTKIEKLTTMVNNRYEKENELRETNERIRNLLSGTNLSIIKQKFIEHFVNIDPFKVVTRYLKDNDLDHRFVDKCKEFKFTNVFDFETSVDNFLKYLKSLNVISRIISSSIDKLEAAYYNIMKSVKEMDINKLLHQDFVMDEDDPTFAVERSWCSKVLMEDEELSDVDDLTTTELEFIKSIFEPLPLQSRRLINETMRFERSHKSPKFSNARINKSKGKPGPKPKGKHGPKLRGKPGPKPKIHPSTATTVISGKPGPKPKILPSTATYVTSEKPITFNKDGSIRKKPGPKLKRKPGPTTKIYPIETSSSKLVVHNKDGSVRKKPGPKTKKKY